ncbi:MAG TPA: hypothetical protein VEK85_17205 [Gemmatimonadales bacterium]|nr:hypothetical protein [Gemmatimonadales bacterium]
MGWLTPDDVDGRIVLILCGPDWRALRLPEPDVPHLLRLYARRPLDGRLVALPFTVPAGPVVPSTTGIRCPADNLPGRHC